MSGGIPPGETDCPECQGVIIHTSACPYRGLTMNEAWRRYKKGKAVGDPAAEVRAHKRVLKEWFRRRQQ